jgi:hypothetical protein
MQEHACTPSGIASNPHIQVSCKFGMLQPYLCPIIRAYCHKLGLPRACCRCLGVRGGRCVHRPATTHVGACHAYPAAQHRISRLACQSIPLGMGHRWHTPFRARTTAHVCCTAVALVCAAAACLGATMHACLPVRLPACEVVAVCHTCICICATYMCTHMMPYSTVLPAVLQAARRASRCMYAYMHLGACAARTAPTTVCSTVLQGRTWTCVRYPRGDPRVSRASCALYPPPPPPLRMQPCKPDIQAYLPVLYCMYCFRRTAATPYRSLA